MFLRTHILFALFLFLFFFNSIEAPFLFLGVGLIATIIPDIDSKFSLIGKKKIFRPLQFFVKHRGIFHSFSFVFLISILLFLFFRTILLPFVLGYSLHLFLDCLTPQGVRVFYPLNFKIKGFFKTGGIFEKLFFVFLVFGSGVLFFKNFV